MIQDNIAYNRRLYDDQQVMSPNRPEEDAPMVNPLNGPQNEQRGPEVLYQQNTLIQHGQGIGDELTAVHLSTFLA